MREGKAYLVEKNMEEGGKEEEDDVGVEEGQRRGCQQPWGEERRWGK